MRTFSTFLLAAFGWMAIQPDASAACVSKLPLNSGALPSLTGRVVFQANDSAYSSSSLYTFDFANSGTPPVQISSGWPVTVSLNPVFSPNGKYIAFTAIKTCSSTTTRDDFVWQIGTSAPVDLTPDCSGNTRSEDPKWSPDGQSLVIKQTNFTNNNVNIVILSLAFGGTGVPSVTGTTTIPNAVGTLGTPTQPSATEPSAPFFSADGRYVYFGRGDCKAGHYTFCSTLGIHQIQLPNGTDVSYSNNGHYAYYPVVRDLTTVFYAGWTTDASNDNTPNFDQIFFQAPLILPGSNQVKSFNDCSSNNSDPASVDSDHIFFSSMSSLLPQQGASYRPVVANATGTPTGSSVWDLSRSGMLSGVSTSLNILGMNYTTAR